MLSATAAVALSVAVTGCGGDPVDPAEQGGPNLGVAVRLASCSDWERGSVAERLGTVAQVREFAGGPLGDNLNGSTLDDDYAYDLFERFCGRSYARGFRLYKLYTRASAFGKELQ